MSFEISNPLYDLMSLNISFFPTKLTFDPLIIWNLTITSEDLSSNFSQDLMADGFWYTNEGSSMNYHIDLPLNFTVGSSFKFSVGNVVIPTSAVSNSFLISTFSNEWLVDQSTFQYSAKPKSLQINYFTYEGIIDGDPVNFTFSVTSPVTFINGTTSLFIEFPNIDSVTFPLNNCSISPSPCTCSSAGSLIKVTNCFTSDSYGVSLTVFIFNSVFNPSTTKPSVPVTLKLVEDLNDPSSVIALNSTLVLDYMIPANMTFASLTPQVSVTSQSTSYTIRITMKNKMPSTPGSIVVYLPKGKFKSTGALSSSLGSSSSFNTAPLNFDTLTISNCLPANMAATTVSVVVNSLSNPETLEPVFGIGVATWSGGYVVDVLNGLNLTVQSPHTFNSILIRSTSFWNLQIANYTIDVTLRFAHYDGDFFTISLPGELNTTMSEISLLAPLNFNLTNVTKIENEFTFYLSTSNVVVPALTVLSFRFSNINNSYMNTPLGAVFIAANASTGYKRSEQNYSSNGLSISPGLFLGNVSMSSNVRMMKNVTYNFSYKPVNKIPFNGYFVLTYPPEILIPFPLECQPLQGLQGPVECIQVSTSKIIFRASEFSSEIAFSITNNTNPNLNTSSIFTISTYNNESSILDQSLPTMLYIAPCDYCLTCSQTRSNCTSCILVNSSLTLLNGNVCVNTCPLGKVNISGTCLPCDTGCRSCESTQSICTTCLSIPAVYYLYRNTCLTTCPDEHYGNETGQICAPCINNCGNCTSETNCTTCSLGYLFLPATFPSGRCLLNCPDFMTPVNKLCKNCAYPCQRCNNTVTNCTSCVENYTLVGNTCLNCETHQFINYTNQTCDDCSSTCLTCSISATNCTSCPSHLFYYAKNSTCLSDCNAPFSSHNNTEGSLICEFSCLEDEFYYSNGTCLPHCNYPFIVRNQTEGAYCDFPCASMSLFFYQNNSCLEECKFPFVIKNYSVGLGCDFNCSYNQYLYLNNYTCSNSCPSPFDIANFTCIFPCSQFDYYYNNGSCLKNCTSPFFVSSLGTNSNTCNFPCSRDMVYFQFNQSCGNFCPEGCTRLASGLEVYCNFLCPKNSFYYSNGSCLERCPFPFLTRNESYGKYCDFSCPTADLFYHTVDKSCQETCTSGIPVNVSIGLLCLPKDNYKFETAAKLFGNVVQGTMAGSGPMLLAGADPTTAVAFMSLLQGFFLLLFYNVRYPENIEAILSSFSVAKFDFLPRPLAWILVEMPEISSPEKFYENGYNGFFLNSASNSLFVLFLFCGIFALAFGIGRLLRLRGLIYKFFKMLYEKMDVSLTLRVVLMQHFELIICSLLQILNFSTKSSLLQLSSALSVLFFVGLILMHALIYKLLASPNVNYAKLKRYEPIIEDYDINDKWKLNFGLLNLTKKFLSYIFLVLLYYYPIFQTLIPCLLGIVVTYAVIKLKPHHRWHLNLVDSISEIGFFCLNICVLMLAYLDYKESMQEDSKKEDNRETIGWIMIGLISIILLVGLMNIWAENLKIMQIY